MWGVACTTPPDRIWQEGEVEMWLRRIEGVKEGER
jgi:hypothetical protein